MEVGEPLPRTHLERFALLYVLLFLFIGFAGGYKIGSNNNKIALEQTTSGYKNAIKSLQEAKVSLDLATKEFKQLTVEVTIESDSP